MVFPDDDWFDEVEKLRKKLWKLYGRWTEPFIESFEMFGGFPVGLFETDEDVIVKADLPGFDKEEIMINVTNNSIEIAAQHKERKEVRKEKYFKSEKRFGAQRRYLTLPVPVNPDSAKAEFKNGVLTVRIKKKEKKEIGKKIKIE